MLFWYLRVHFSIERREFWLQLLSGHSLGSNYATYRFHCCGDPDLHFSLAHDDVDGKE